MMQTPPVDWVPAISIVAVGIVTGLALIIWFRRSAPARLPASPEIPELPELEIRDLEAQRDALLQQLRELDETATKLTPNQLARERYRLELETAQVLRDLEGRERAAAVVHEEEVTEDLAPARAPQSAVAGFLWGVGAMAALAALIVLVMQRAEPREEGGSLTGSVPEMQAPASADIAALQQAVDANPEDLNARIELAYGHLAQRDLMNVFNQTQFVLERDPENARALSLQALVRLAMGQAEEAEGMLKKALEKEPDLLDAWIHLAIVNQQMGKNEEALAALDEAIRRHPEERATLESLAAELRGVPAAAQPQASQPAAAAASEPSVSGTIELAPGMAARGQLLVSVRPAGVAAGPPVAVKMMGAVALPTTFTITSGDSMMGQPLPEKMRIDVRLDSDGDVMSRTPGDPQASIDNVAAGASDLKLVLK